VFLAVEGHAAGADLGEFGDHALAPGYRARRQGWQRIGQQFGDPLVGQAGEQRFAVGAAIGGKQGTHGADGAQPVRCDDLVDEQDLVVFEHGQVHGFVESMRQLLQVGTQVQDQRMPDSFG